MSTLWRYINVRRRGMAGVAKRSSLLGNGIPGPAREEPELTSDFRDFDDRLVR